MVSKVQAIGKKDVSLEEEKRAAGKTGEEPQGQEKDERILQVIYPRLSMLCSRSVHMRQGGVFGGYDASVLKILQGS